MPLKIRIKPEGKFYVNGAILRNAGNRPIDLVVEKGDVTREGYKPKEKIDDCIGQVPVASGEETSA